MDDEAQPLDQTLPNRDKLEEAREFPSFKSYLKFKFDIPSDASDISDSEAKNMTCHNFRMPKTIAKLADFYDNMPSDSSGSTWSGDETFEKFLDDIRKDGIDFPAFARLQADSSLVENPEQPGQEQSLEEEDQGYTSPFKMSDAFAMYPYFTT